MTPEDIRRVVVVEELDLSTDGRLAVVVAARSRATDITGTCSRSTWIAARSRFDRHLR
jgi:hypothetical protein